MAFNREISQSVNRGAGSGEMLRGCFPLPSPPPRIPLPHLPGLWTQWVQVIFAVKHIFFIKVLLQKKKIVLFIIVNFITINLLGRAWSHTL